MKSSPNRRAFLRGIGASRALPAMESFGDPIPNSAKSGIPLRLAYLYFPNDTAEGT
ncbi:MAG: hypothetical protein QNL33_15635 [Akkermansiaceae bacterium]|jgi:hypothetical protein